MSWSLPHLPPLTAFFSRGRNILFQISGGAYAPPILKQGGHMHTVPHGCARLCLCPHFYCISALNLFAPICCLCFGPLYMAFLYCSFYSFRSFTFLKAIAKSKSTHIAIVFKNEKEQ